MTAEKILVLAIRAIGDMVLVTPAIRALKERFPEASISVVTEAFSADVFLGNPRIAEIIVIDRWARKGLSMPRRLAMDVGWLRRIRSGGFDTVVDLFCGPRSAQMSLFSGAPVRIAEAVRGRRIYYTRTVKVEHAGRHLVEQKMQIVEPLTGPVPVPPTEIFLEPREREEAEERLRAAADGSAGPFIGLFPGAGWEHKQWPTDRFAKIADRLGARGYFPVVIGGARDEAACRDVAGAIEGRKAVFAGILRLRETMALIGGMTLFISNDTGPMHIAAGLGIPTIGIFGPSDMVKYRPWGDHAHAISARLPCSPCPQQRDTCRLQGRRPRECMEAIPVSWVEEKALEILGGAVRPPRGGRAAR